MPKKISTGNLNDVISTLNTHLNELGLNKLTVQLMEESARSPLHTQSILETKREIPRYGMKDYVIEVIKQHNIPNHGDWTFEVGIFQYMPKISTHVNGKVYVFNVLENGLHHLRI